jgi:hypothetical protein
MLSLLADSLLIATRMEPLRRDAWHNQIDPRHELEKRKWFQFIGFRD